MHSLSIYLTAIIATCLYGCAQGGSYHGFHLGSFDDFHHGGSDHLEFHGLHEEAKEEPKKEEGGGHHEVHEEEEKTEHHAPRNYHYDYSVHDLHTHDIKTQWETRDGDTVKGEYTIVEPDGSKRIVQYTADKHNGFNAVVKNVKHGYEP